MQIFLNLSRNYSNTDVKIVIEDIQKDRPASQKELYERSLALRERFRDVKVDPNLDLSTLANEVNL